VIPAMAATMVIRLRVAESGYTSRARSRPVSTRARGLSAGVSRAEMVRSSNNNGKVVVDFLIVAFVLFMIIKLLNTVRRKRESALTAPPKLSNLKVLLAEIRDLFTRGFEAVCTFALACNRFFKQDEETQKEVSFFEVTTWSHRAEVCGESTVEGPRRTRGRPVEAGSVGGTRGAGPVEGLDSGGAR